MCEGEDCKPVRLSHCRTVLPLPRSQGSTKEYAGREAPTAPPVPPSPSNQSGREDKKLSLTFSLLLIFRGTERIKEWKGSLFPAFQGLQVQKLSQAITCQPFLPDNSRIYELNPWRRNPEGLCLLFDNIFQRTKRFFKIKQSVYATAPNTDGTRGLNS